MDQKKMVIRRAGERGHADHGWLRTWHTFSFADYHDEAWMGFKSLRVINEDFIAPGKGFDLHGHRDMEILTYVMSGALRHVDTMGNNEVIRAGEFQRMTAGTGVQHMEVSATQTEETHLYQIWILPKEKGLTPSYESLVIPSAAEGSVSSGLLIASLDGRDGSLTIHQDIEIRLYRLKAGETATIEVPTGKAGWVQIVSGEVEVGGETLRASDAVGTAETTEIKAVSKLELLGFVL
ncbi:MAG: pirin family protein [Patescibacteria group bacterium]